MERGFNSCNCSLVQAIYNRGMSVDRLLELLKQFKDSTVKKDRVR